MSARRLYFWTGLASLLYGSVAGLLFEALPANQTPMLPTIVILIPTIVFVATLALLLGLIIQDGLSIQRLGRQKYESSMGALASQRRSLAVDAFLAALMFFTLGLGVFVLYIVRHHL